MAEHTPTPWFHRQAGEAGPGDQKYDWIADDPRRGQHHKIIVSRDSCDPADYAFIVKAVNAHDALVKALKSLTNEVSGIFDAFEYGIRQEISNTNFAVVCDKLEEANRVLGNVLVPSQNDQSDPDVIREGKAKWPY